MKNSLMEVYIPSFQGIPIVEGLAYKNVLEALRHNKVHADMNGYVYIDDDERYSIRAVKVHSSFLEYIESLEGE